MDGAVTLSFDSGQPYSFTSTAVWPSGDDYTRAVRAAVEEVLLRRQGDLDLTKVVLKAIEFDPVDSCEAGFRHAARAATEAAFPA